MVRHQVVPQARRLRPKLLDEATHLFLGRGCMAQSLAPYLRKSGLKYFHWIRDARSYLKEIDKSLELNPSGELSAGSNLVIWLSLSDSALKSAVTKLKRRFPKATLIHFSGALFFDHALGFHPPYPILLRNNTRKPDWRNMPFTLEKEHQATWKGANLRPLVKQIFLGDKVFIHAKDKTIYHAFCVLVSSIPLVLYEAVSVKGRKLGVPSTQWHRLMEASLSNWQQLGKKGLNGPLVRKDTRMVKAHLDALKKNAFLKKIYQLTAREVVQWH